MAAVKECLLGHGTSSSSSALCKSDVCGKYSLLLQNLLLRANTGLLQCDGYPSCPSSRNMPHYAAQMRVNIWSDAGVARGNTWKLLYNLQHWKHRSPHHQNRCPLLLGSPRCLYLAAPMPVDSQPSSAVACSSPSSLNDSAGCMCLLLTPQCQKSILRASTPSCCPGRQTYRVLA